MTENELWQKYTKHWLGLHQKNLAKEKAKYKKKTLNPYRVCFFLEAQKADILNAWSLTVPPDTLQHSSYIFVFSIFQKGEKKY